MSKHQPSTHGGGGHTFRGTFAKGNRLGVGNPLAGRAAKLRGELLRAASREERKAICRQLIDQAINGDLAAIREYFDRTIGKAVAFDIIERIEALEAKAQPQRNNGHGREHLS